MLKEIEIRSEIENKKFSGKAYIGSDCICFVPNKNETRFNPIFQTMMYCKHRCTKVENPGGGGPGVSKIFAKIPKGGQGFQEKLPWGYPYFGFYKLLLHFY
jgi:hypothetical protein